MFYSVMGSLKELFEMKYTASLVDNVRINLIDIRAYNGHS